MSLRAGSAGLILLWTLVGCEGAANDTRPEGPSDVHATAACAALSGSAVPVAAAETPDAAGDAVLLPGDAPYRVTLPPAGAGYVHVRVVEEHVDLAFFASERGAFAEFEGDALGTSRRNGACPDRLLEDYRAHVHDPRDYLLTFAADAPRELVVLVMQTGQGHGETDGGAHHHHDDGGTHHHDDGGAHDHDGGMCGGPNAHCYENADCCSGDCHVDHCH